MSNTLKVILLILGVAALGAGLYFKYLYTPGEPPKKPEAAAEKTVEKAQDKAEAPEAASKAESPDKAGPPAPKAEKGATPTPEKPGASTGPEKVAAAKKPPPPPEAAARKTAPAKTRAEDAAKGSSPGLYHLQLGVFRSRESSLELAGEVDSGPDLPVRVDSFVNRRGEKLYVVYLFDRVGYREGLEMARELSGRGFDSVLVHHRNLLGERKIYP